MVKNLRTIIIIVAVILAALFINRYLQGRYTTSSKAIFSGDTEKISRFTISKTDESITLVKMNGVWNIEGHDTLIVRQPRLDNLFNSVLTTEHETMVSKNPAKWNVYSVDDSLGIRLQLFDSGDKILGNYYFGRSKADWSHNNFRFAGEDAVYLTSTNVIYHLNTTANYWGEKPKPPEPDTTAVSPAEMFEEEE